MKKNFLAKNLSDTANNKTNKITDLDIADIQNIAGSIGSVATLAEKTKAAAKIAKAQEMLSKATQTVSMAKDVIHRMQKASRSVNQAKSLVASTHTPNLPVNAPFSMLTSLFNRSPSGLQFTLSVAGLPPTLFSVLAFQYQTHYNTLPCLTVTLSSSEADISPQSVLDQPVSLTIWQDGEHQQTLSGIVTSIETGDSGFRLTHYHLVIFPELWRATLRHNARIFQQQDIETIITTLLHDNHVTDYAFILRHPHPVREFCVQYQETDFTFLQRLVAEEGLFYYFEQHDNGSRLIFSDDANTLSPENNVAVPYNLNQQAQQQESIVSSFNLSEQVRPSEVTLKDYTFKKPNWQAQFSAKADDVQFQRLGYEHYDFPGRFKDGRGKQYSQYRLDSLRHDAHLGWGKSNHPQLQLGRLLALENHPQHALNTYWQITGLTYQGKQPQAAENEAGDKATTLNCHFQVVSSHQTWRALQQTKPRVDGPQVAIVTGPAGEEIYTDKFGRIRVQFLWDREGQYNDHSSCWIRVTQPWAGKGWGMMAIPRVGQEVVVDFIEGDPDQPIVTGRSYHATMPLPAGFPKAKPQMDLMSQTHKGSGYNGIMMDDSTHNQRLNLHAQRDMNTKVLNNRSTTVNGNHTEVVVGSQQIQIEKARFKEVVGDETTMIKQHASRTAGQEYKLLVTGDVILESLSDKITLETAGGIITLTKAGDIAFEGSQIAVHGTVTHLNPNSPITQPAGQLSAGAAGSTTSPATGGEGGESTSVWTLTKNAAEDGYIHNNQKGIDAKATAFTASYGNGEASAKMLDMSVEGKYAGLDSKVLSADAHYKANQNSISLGTKAIGAEIVGKIHLGDQNLGAKGDIRGTLGTAAAGAKLQGYLGEKNIYGAEVGGELRAMAVEAEAKGEFLSRYLDMKAGVSASAGSVGVDFMGRALADTDKGVVSVGVAGKAAALLGLGADVEAELKYKNMCKDIDFCKNYFELE